MLRQCALIAVIALLEIVTSPSSGRAATSTKLQSSDPALAGRLGGERTGFDLAYGEPIADNVGSGAQYAVEGFGLVSISYLALANRSDPSDTAAVIILRSPRPERVPATMPDPADWSLRAARAAAARFLPDDAEIGPTGPGDADGRLAASCQSASLAARYPDESDSGDCRISFLAPTQTTVSFITLALGQHDAASPVADPCDGMTAWAGPTGERMTAANNALAAIEEIDPAASDAAAQIEGIATELSASATAQAQVAVPAAALDANAALISAFTAYADALTLAAQGVTQGDDGLVTQATTDVGTARSGYATANDLVIAALQGCDLVS